MQTPNPLSKSADDGFTLIELILVIVIAVVAMFPLLSMYSHATIRSVEPLLYTQAAFLAQESIEAVLADYTAAVRGYSYIDNVNYPAVSSPAGFPGFTITVNVAAEATYDAVLYKETTVTVSHSAIDDVTLKTWVTQ